MQIAVVLNPLMLQLNWFPGLKQSGTRLPELCLVLSL